jgi:hypothetical protein
METLTSRTLPTLSCNADYSKSIYNLGSLALQQTCALTLFIKRVFNERSMNNCYLYINQSQ